MVGEYVPNRGHLVWLDFNPQAGKEQAKRRPALVLSPKLYNRKSGLAICCPITSKQKGWPFEVALSGDIEIQGAILTDHVKSLDYRVRNAVYIQSCPDIVVDEVLARLRTILT